MRHRSGGNWIRRACVLAATAVVAWGLAGCNRNITGGHQETPEAERRAEWAVQQQQGRQVNVRLSGDRIEMPQSLPPGPTVFRVRNTGQTEHSFRIEGQGVERELSATLRPGESGTVTIVLEPGIYRIHHPSPAHGEDRVFELTVTGQAGGTQPQGQPGQR